MRPFKVADRAQVSGQGSFRIWLQKGSRPSNSRASAAMNNIGSRSVEMSLDAADTSVRATVAAEKVPHLLRFAEYSYAEVLGVPAKPRSAAGCCNLRDSIAS